MKHSLYTYSILITITFGLGLYEHDLSAQDMRNRSSSSRTRSTNPNRGQRTSYRSGGSERNRRQRTTHQRESRAASSSHAPRTQTNPRTMKQPTRGATQTSIRAGQSRQERPEGKSQRYVNRYASGDKQSTGTKKYVNRYTSNKERQGSRKFDRDGYGKHGRYYNRYGYRRRGPGFNFWLTYPVAYQQYYTYYQNSCRLFNDTDYELTVFTENTPRLTVPSGASIFLPCGSNPTIESSQLGTSITSRMYDGISVDFDENNLFVD